MLSKAQEKLIKSLQTKKGREKSGLCLVEGEKVLETAGKAVQFAFTERETENFLDLITTETPQAIAGVAQVPSWNQSDLEQFPTILVLDGVQDPGNVGAIIRLCLGFNASLLLVESADVTNPKVVRSSVGALFQVPWMNVNRDEALKIISSIDRPIYRLEKTDADGAKVMTEEKTLLIAGSEGSGIHLPVEGISLSINHSENLESLNVGHAVAIVLAQRYEQYIT